MSDQLENLKSEDLSIGDRLLSIPSELPVLPLRDTVLFPNSFMPLAVARESSVRLIDDAIANGKLIAVFTQRDAAVEEPKQEDLFRVGTATHIHKMFKLPDGSLRLIVQGLARLTLDEVVATEPYLRARVSTARRRHEGRRSSRDRRARAQHQDQLPAGRVAVAAAFRRSADARDEHHASQDGSPTSSPRRCRRSARRSNRKCWKRSISARGWTALNRILIKELEVLELGSKIQSQVQSEVGQEPARILPARADEGDSEGARRRRRSDQGHRGADGKDRSGGHARRRSRRRRCASSTACRRCRLPPPNTRSRGPISTGSSRCRGTSAAKK